MRSNLRWTVGRLRPQYLDQRIAVHPVVQTLRAEDERCSHRDVCVQRAAFEERQHPITDHFGPDLETASLRNARERRVGHRADAELHSCTIWHPVSYAVT